MPVARMAVQFHDGTSNGDWKQTGKSPFVSPFTTNIGDNPDDTTSYVVPDNAWGQVRSVTYGVDREYGGVNSSGGPQHSGRADARLVSVERESDMISPYLLKRCFNGMQLKRVIIFDPDYGDPGQGVVIYLEDNHVVSFEGIIQKNAGQKHGYSSTGMGQGDQYFGYTKAASQSVGSTSRIDRMTILFTKITVQVLGSDYQGWDTGTETHFDVGPKPLS